MGNSNDRPVSNITVKSFDISQYAGVWYEVASIPRPDRIKCQGTTEFYIKSEDTLMLYNYCFHNNKIIDTAIGTLTINNKDDPGKLTLTYKERLFGRSIQYWIYDTNYTSYSVVSNGDKNSLRILSRQTTMSNKQITELLTIILNLGFDVSTLKTSIDILDK